MRISEQWLREWVDPACSTEALAEALTMAGLEVDAVEDAAPALDGVIVARVAGVDPVPGSDHLHTCRVEAGKRSFQVVCGAPNVRPGLLAPLATPGAVLPDGTVVREAEVRGVHSQGVLCSASELGLSDEAAGLFELDPDLTPGTPLSDALGLPDTVIEVDLTPNRADCLGMIGVAREVGACTRTPVDDAHCVADPVPPTIDATRSIARPAHDACPVYCGRVLTGVDATRPTPTWMRERLRRAGVRSVSALVDITNYLLIETGQPLHAFDHEHLNGTVSVRWADGQETLRLLSGDEITPDTDTLLIADDRGPVALAGVMGGQDSAVTDGTTQVFLESAHFAPTAIVGRARRYGLHTDASHRFERGVDPALPEAVAERATQLILAICGGEAGPLNVSRDPVSRPVPVTLRRERLQRLLGWSLGDDTVHDILQRLGLQPQATETGWSCTPPTWRFDIAREEDLVEEVARLCGYDQVPERRLHAPMTLHAAPEARIGADAVRETLVGRGYHEAITYSFVDADVQRQLDPERPALPLANPLSAELGVMRTSLWPGLLSAVQRNQARQQPRVRLFEVGRAFLGGTVAQLEQPWRVAAVATGRRQVEHWDWTATPPVDFFDIKGDVEALVGLTGLGDGLDGTFSFEAAEHPALHPGQSARVFRSGEPVGWLGRLHPAHVEALELHDPVVLFELDLEALGDATLPAFRPISRYPAVRRDLAVVVEEAVSAAALEQAVREAAGNVLREIRVFDIYRGKGVPDGHKSLGLGLIVQDETRTLTDADVEALVSGVVRRLETAFGATLRGEHDGADQGRDGRATL